jgi:protein-disulfide isomerase
MLFEEYVETGKITFEYRDFAFLGPESYKAAEAAWCALDQDRFWDYHDTIFANHGGENRGDYSDGRLKAMAEALQLDTDAFNECFDNREHEEDVLQSYQEGSAEGINRTPTLVINGEHVQYQGIDALRAKLDEVLGE